MCLREHTGPVRRTFNRSRQRELIEWMLEAGEADKEDLRWWFGWTIRQLNVVNYQCRIYGHVPAGMALRAKGCRLYLEDKPTLGAHTLDDVQEWT